VLFEIFSSPVLNSAGHVAFSAILSRSKGIGIWSDASGDLEIIARSGTQAPDMPSGMHFVGFSFQFPSMKPVLNSNGNTAFAASTGGPPYVGEYGPMSRAVLCSKSLTVLLH
jgi:hypothetical protein